RRRKSWRRGLRTIGGRTAFVRFAAFKPCTSLRRRRLDQVISGAPAIGFIPAHLDDHIAALVFQSKPGAADYQGAGEARHSPAFKAEMFYAPIDVSIGLLVTARGQALVAHEPYYRHFK